MNERAIRVLLLFLLSGWLIVFSSASHAQDIWSSYCTYNVNNQRICGKTAEEVLELYNADLINKPIWEPDGTIFASDPGSIAIGYRVAYLAPTTGPALYNYNSYVTPISTGFAAIPGCSAMGCEDEQTVISFLTNKTINEGHPEVTFRIEGQHAQSYTTNGVTTALGYGGDRKFIATYNGSDHVFSLGKFMDFTCTPGHSGNGGDDIPFSKLCGGEGTLYIVAKLQQRSSCQANGNPCYPVTADKARFEKDFEFAGRPFVRSYHSVQQISTPGMAAGWGMSYAERGNYAMGVDGNGFVDIYIYAEGKYRSRFDKNVFVTQHTEGQVTTGYTRRDKDGTYRDFDQYGVLLRVYDPAHPENDVTVVHDAYGRVDRLIDARGREAVFAYTEATILGLLSSITLPDGREITYSYDGAKNLIAAHYPDGSAKGYLYNESGLVVSQKPHLLSGIVDENNSRYASFGYDSRGRVTLSKLQGDVEVTSLSYTSNQAIVQTDGKGTRTYTIAPYDFSMPTSISTAGQGQIKYQYTSPNMLSQRTNKNGSVDNFQYVDAFLSFRGEATQTPAARWTEYQRDGNGNFLLIRQGYGLGAGYKDVLELSRTYNSRNQALTETRLDLLSGGTQTGAMTYCESADVAAGTCPLLGLLTSVNGPRTDVNDTTTYTYYPSDDATCATAPTTCPHRKGDLWKVTNALGQVTETLAYDGAGRVLSVKDVNGVISDMEYHLRGWLIARKTRGTNASVETDDAITRIEYWPTGLVKKVIQPDGAFTLYTYDGAHRLTDIADNAGNTIHYTLDNAGNRTQEDTKDPGNALKRTLSRVYNQLGQLQIQNDADLNPIGFTYDVSGNTNTVTDALSRVTDNDYDPLNRLSRTLQNVGGINAETKFAYDGQDNLTQVTDPKGLNTNYTYNGLGDLTQLISPDTGITTYTYDSAGNRATQADARGQTSTYSYDVLNRLIGIAYATPSLNVAYTYDSTQAACTTGETFSTGRLTRLTDASGTTQYCYDRFGHLVRKVQTTNGVALTVRYAYTLVGQLSSVTYPDGAVVAYTRDTQGRTTQVNVQRAGTASEVLLNQASYHPFGPVAGWTYGNGRQLLRPVNQDYRPTAIQDPGVGGLSVGFAYDPVGNLTQLTAAGDTTPLVKFDYDALNRLIAFNDGPTDVAIESYTFDATGNRQSFTDSIGTQDYTYPSTSHRLSQVGATARSYDAAGNTTAIGGTAKEFVYDETGRMSQVKQNAIVQRSYAYNGKGEQVRKYTGTANTYTLYDEAGHWLGDYDNTGAALQQAIWLDDLPVGLIANGNQLHYVEPDHLGTPRVVIEVARNVPVWTWDLKSEAFGNSVPAQDPDGDSNPLTFDMRFPGQQYDAASGLNQNGNRDYDPAIGRYPKSDPLGLRGGISTYSYAYSNPLMWIDPDGLQARGAVNTTGPVGAAGAYNPNNPNNVSPEVPTTSSGSGWPQIKPPEITGDGLLESLFTMSGLGALSQIEQTISNKLNNVCDDGDSERCEREWREARRVCRQLIFEQMQQAAGRRKKRSVTGVTGGFTDVEQCARGLVSESCGGNRVKE